MPASRIAKAKVAGPNPVFRSKISGPAGMMPTGPFSVYPNRGNGAVDPRAA